MLSKCAAVMTLCCLLLTAPVHGNEPAKEIGAETVLAPRPWPSPQVPPQPVPAAAQTVLLPTEASATRVCEYLATEEGREAIRDLALAMSSDTFQKMTYSVLADQGKTQSSVTCWLAAAIVCSDTSDGSAVCRHLEQTMIREHWYSWSGTPLLSYETPAAGLPPVRQVSGPSPALQEAIASSKR